LANPGFQFVLGWASLWPNLATQGFLYLACSLVHYVSSHPDLAYLLFSSINGHFMNLWWPLIHGVVSTSLAYNMLVGSWKLGGERGVGEGKLCGKGDTIHTFTHF